MFIETIDEIIFNIMNLYIDNILNKNIKNEKDLIKYVENDINFNLIRKNINNPNNVKKIYDVILLYYIFFYLIYFDIDVNKYIIHTKNDHNNRFIHLLNSYNTNNLIKLYDLYNDLIILINNNYDINTIKNIYNKNFFEKMGLEYMKSFFKSSDKHEIIKILLFRELYL
jgi:hypothetical protein